MTQFTAIYISILKVYSNVGYEATADPGQSQPPVPSSELLVATGVPESTRAENRQLPDSSEENVPMGPSHDDQVCI